MRTNIILAFSLLLSIFMTGSALAVSPSSPGVGPLNVSIAGGNAGGDLGGTYPNPTVLQFNGTPLGSMATQGANAVAITGGTIDGATVGATTAAAIKGTTINASGLLTAAGTVSGGTTFTIASGCGSGGTAPSSLTGGKATGSFVANATACSPVLTLPTAPHGWWCNLIDLTHPADTFTETGESSTTCTMTVASAVTALDVLIFHAEAY